MADTVEIPKIPTGDGWYGRWCSLWWNLIQTQEGKPLKPIIRCNCGQGSGIGLHHVHADGTVTASFYHKKGTNYSIGEDPNGCEWHVYLKLLDYDCGDFPPD